MKYEIVRTNQFKRDYKLLKKRGWDLLSLAEIIDLLADGIPLDAKHKDHSLTGKWANYRECHIEPDWLLIYYIENETLSLVLSRSGTHSDLF